MKFNEFINDVKNKGGVDTDGYYGKQCMDLYNYFCNNVLGLKNVGSSCAKNILSNKNIMDNVDRIDNYPEFIPQKGDIAVWIAGTYGHVAICLGDGDLNKFKTLDQNWKPQILTEEWHNYTYLTPLVFLRPKNQENIVELKPVDNSFEVRVDKKEAAVRSQATSKSALAGTQILVKGNTFKAVDIVKGENVQGIDTWYKSAKGNYVWSYGLTRI